MNTCLILCKSPFWCQNSTEPSRHGHCSKHHAASARLSSSINDISTRFCSKRYVVNKYLHSQLISTKYLVYEIQPSKTPLGKNWRYNEAQFELRIKNQLLIIMFVVYATYWYEVYYSQVTFGKQSCISVPNKTGFSQLSSLGGRRVWRWRKAWH